MLPPQTERKMAERIRARETIELDTSHASLVTRPTEVLELITSAAAAVLWGRYFRREQTQNRPKLGVLMRFCVCSRVIRCRNADEFCGRAQSIPMDIGAPTPA
jgi:hypothetical protein